MENGLSPSYLNITLQTTKNFKIMHRKLHANCKGTVNVPQDNTHDVKRVLKLHSAVTLEGRSTQKPRLPDVASLCCPRNYPPAFRSGTFEGLGLRICKDRKSA